MRKTCRRSRPRNRLACGFALLLVGWSLAAAAADLSPAGNPWITVWLGKTQVRAEVVTSPEKLYLGLSGRRDLPWGMGMLFVFPFREVQTFCMRGMLIPIDIIWIDQGRISGFHTNRQPHDPSNFTSPGPVDLVLEVPAGFVAATGLRPGMSVVLGP